MSACTELYGVWAADVDLLPTSVFACNSPQVTFCGYSIPHPTEDSVNIRVQTTGVLPGLVQLCSSLCSSSASGSSSPQVSSSSSSSGSGCGRKTGGSIEVPPARRSGCSSLCSRAASRRWAWWLHHTYTEQQGRRGTAPKKPT